MLELLAVAFFLPQEPVQGNLLGAAQSLWVDQTTVNHNWSSAPARDKGMLRRTGVDRVLPEVHQYYNDGPDVSTAPFVGKGLDIVAVSTNGNWIAMDKASGEATALADETEGWAGVALSFERIDPAANLTLPPVMENERAATGNGIGADSFQYNFADSSGIPAEIRDRLLKFSDNEMLRLEQPVTSTNYLDRPEIQAFDLFLPPAFMPNNVFPTGATFAGLVFAAKEPLPAKPASWNIANTDWNGATLFVTYWSPLGGWQDPTVFIYAAELGLTPGSDQVQAVSWDSENGIVAFVGSDDADEIRWVDLQVASGQRSANLLKAKWTGSSLVKAIDDRITAVSISGLCFYDPRIKGVSSYMGSPASTAAGIDIGVWRAAHPEPVSITSSANILSATIATHASTFPGSSWFAVLNWHASVGGPLIAPATPILAIEYPATDLSAALLPIPLAKGTAYLQALVGSIDTGVILPSQWMQIDY